MIPVPAPGTPEHDRIMTASKVAACIGLHPWSSPRALYHRMRGELPPEPERPEQWRGHMDEATVLQWWRRQHPDAVVEDGPYGAWLDDDGWAAATPDLVADSGVVDAKTTRDGRGYGEPGTDEVPAYIKVQMLWQLAVYPDAPRAWVAVRGPYLDDFREYIVERDDAATAVLVERARWFWADVQAGRRPAVDGLAVTLAAIRRATPGIDDATVTVPVELADELARSADALAAAEDAARAARARLLDEMGAARYAETPDGRRVARRQRAKSGAALHLTH